MNVSVICPTFNRQDRHKNLYKVFSHQTYENKELLVLDDSVEASPFFSELQDSRVKYYHLPMRAALGHKRDYLIEKAEGEVIAHFDDDDYYAPHYLSTMVPFLKQSDFVKFSKWMAWRESDGSLWEWDAALLSPKQFIISGDDTTTAIGNPIAALNETERLAFIDRTLWGFGFSYVYFKSAAKGYSFGDVYHGEDYNFVCALRKQGKRLLYAPDSEHLTLHILHPQSSSRIYPQVRLQASKAQGLLGSAVVDWLYVENKR